MIRVLMLITLAAAIVGCGGGNKAKQLPKRFTVSEEAELLVVEATARMVVLTRFQLTLLIFAEGLLLAAIGFVGGLALSWAMLQIVALAAKRMLHHGAVIGVHSITLAAVATFGAAFLAAAIPAWRATRVKPSMNSVSNQVRSQTRSSAWLRSRGRRSM